MVTAMVTITAVVMTDCGYGYGYGVGPKVRALLVLSTNAVETPPTFYTTNTSNSFFEGTI